MTSHDGPARSPEPTRQVQIPATGLTVVFTPDKPTLDIVFVHGFSGSPSSTWTYRSDGNHDEPATQRFRAQDESTRQERDGKPSRTVFWPQDLVPNIVPNARVLTFGYDTKIRHRTGNPVSTYTTYDIAWGFLVALEARRREDIHRPILFIAHSLGGIVVKELLRRSSTCSTSQAHLRSVFRATAGIMFFGTPHAGADIRGTMQRIAIWIIKSMGFESNEQIVNSLSPTAERLKELRDSFGPLAEDRKWIIHSFQEQYRAKLLGQKIVEDASSCLNNPAIEITEHIGRDHSGMVKFSGLNDPEFKKVAAALERMVLGISKPSSHSLRRIIRSLRSLRQK